MKCIWLKIWFGYIFIIVWLSPMKTRGYRVELVRLSVRLSVPLDIGYFVHASLGWRSWARAFKFYTRIHQDLKSCLVNVSSRSVENCRFWNTLKIVDFNHFYRCQALCAGEFGMKQLSYTYQILFSYKPRSEVVPC